LQHRRQLPHEDRGDRPIHRRPRREEEPPSYTEDEPQSSYYPTEDPSYRYPGSYGDRGRGDWPECEGTCPAGTCQLDKARPGCCHLARGGRGSYGGQGYAATAGAGGAEGSVAAGVAAAARDTAVSSSSVAAASLYTREGDANLVYWRDGEFV
jgi:hypothetical protein